MTDKTPAMPEPLGWYVVNNIGVATLCANEAEAQLLAEDCDMVYQRQAPHRAVQLVALATLQAQPAEVSDAEIRDALEAEFLGEAPNRVWEDDLRIARAILALRPQAVPMTDERLAEVLTTAYGSPEWTMDDVRAARSVEAAALGITAQGAQGGEG